jgi:hypothetical protein
VASKPKRLFTSVRPARVACLVHEEDPDWQESCLRVIEFFSRVWGGAYNIIVPTDGKDLAPLFWKVLYAYDADYIYYFYKTGIDQKIVHPDEYDAKLESELQNFLKAAPTADVNHARRQIDELLCRNPLMPDPTPELGELIRRRLAPFHVLGHVIDSVASDSPVRLPLAPIATILSESEEIADAADFQPSFGGMYPLWLASITGAANDGFREDMKQLTRQVFDVPVKDYSIDLVTNRRTIDGLLSGGNVKTPFDLTNVGLGTYYYRKVPFPPSVMIVVAGDTLQDFSLYYCLNRIRQPVFWFPYSWLKSERTGGGTATFDLFAQSLTLRGSGAEKGCIFTSSSLQLDELTQVVEEVKQKGAFWSLTGQSKIDVTVDCHELICRPFRVFENGNAAHPISLTVQESSEIELFDTPKPKNFRKIHPYDHRWITDVTISGHYLPRNPLLGGWAIRSPMLGRNGARIGAGTLSYFCPTIMYKGGDIDSVLVRPTLFIPSTFEIFEELFRHVGYAARLSDKGFFADDAIRKFRGLDALATFLRDAFSRSLIFKFLDASEGGGETDGYILTDQRRYLTLPAVSKILLVDDAGQKTIEMLMAQDIVYRGCIFKCRYCRNADWFGLDQFSQTFRCKRCARTQHISNENYWYGRYEPGWCYKLDEIIYQFLRHNGDVGVLALDCLRKRSEESFLFTTDLELIKSDSTDQKPEFELDICSIVDGEIVLGEAKKENRLGESARAENREIQKYVNLATQMGAKKLAFATLADSWSDETLKKVERATEKRDLDLIMLNRSDLFSV